jgi:hypothetical protein
MNAVLFHHTSITSRDFKDTDAQIWTKICKENNWNFKRIELKNDNIQYDLYFNQK